MQLEPAHLPPVEQTEGGGHVPQLSVPPQPSGADPHSIPCAAQVIGVQVGGGGVPPQTGDARSKNMNSSAPSCADMLVLDVMHSSFGNSAPGSFPDAT